MKQDVFYRRTVVWGIAALAFCCMSLHTPANLSQQGRIRTLIIDAGHGGKDPGASGASHKEKHIVLNVALQLAETVRNYMPEIKVILTRDSDEFIELYKRGDIAKENKGDFFISIHCDANPNHSAHGSTAYILGSNDGTERYESYIRENQVVQYEDNYKEQYEGFDPQSPEAYIFFRVVKNVYRTESMLLANHIQAQIETRAQRKNRGVKQAPFVVLWRSAMPSILCEIGFISNRDEEVYLASDHGQLYIASAIFRAVRDYNNGVLTPVPQDR